MEPVRWGVLSTADIGLRKVIPAMKGSELSQVAGIASRSLQSAEEAATQLDIPQAHGSYQDLLEDPGIEAVYIPLPNHLHHDWTVAAAEAGKHVLCEKPLAMTSREAQEMVDTCAERGVLLMEAFMYRLHPLWLEAKRLVDTGAIGELRSVHTVFSYFNDDPANIRNVPEWGGGALYDIGCYAVNAARLLFGSEPELVKGVLVRDERFGTDIVTSAVLGFGAGISTFVCSTQMAANQRVEVHGTTGLLVVETPFHISPDRPSSLSVVTDGLGHPVTESRELAAANPYTVQADAFSRAIRTGSTAPIPPEDAVANLAVIERIFDDAG